MKRMQSLAALLLGGALALPTQAGENMVKLKDGPNRELVQASCSICHSADYIPMNSPFLKRAGWQATVTKMMKVMGAPIKDADVPAIVDYLTKQYGVE